MTQSVNKRHTRGKEKKLSGLTQIHLENTICRGERHSPSLGVVLVRKS